MTTSRYPEITDELLSAYIDNAVSEEERALVERAILDDASVAWRLATLQETVRLLRNLPLLQAPRSFALTSDQVGQPLHEPAPVVGVVTAEPPSMADAPRRTPSPRPGKWSEWVEGWRRFWRSGSPVWRNAMAASMALLLVTLILPTFLTIEQPPTAVLSGPAVSSVPEAMEMAQPAAPAALDRRNETEATARKIDSPAQEASPAPHPTEAAVSAVAVAAETVEEPSSMVASSAAPNVQPQGAALPAASEAEGAAFGDSYGDPLQPMRTGSGMVPMHTEGSIASSLGEVRSAAVPPAAALARESAQDVAAETAPQAPGGAAPIASPMRAETAQPVLTPEAEHAPEQIAPAPASEEATAGAESLDRSEDFAPPQGSTAASVEESAETTLTTGEAPANGALAAPPTSQEERTAVLFSSAAVVAFLHWLRLGAAGALVVFGLLWWRSRRN